MGRKSKASPSDCAGMLCKKYLRSNTVLHSDYIAAGRAYENTVTLSLIELHIQSHILLSFLQKSFPWISCIRFLLPNLDIFHACHQYQYLPLPFISASPVPAHAESSFTTSQGSTVQLSRKEASIVVLENNICSRTTSNRRQHRYNGNKYPLHK
jgi:hypothetical protein